MDLFWPGVFAAIGFGGALLMRKLVSTLSQRGGRESLPVEKGAVRLDQVGKKGKKGRQ